MSPAAAKFLEALVTHVGAAANRHDRDDVMVWLYTGKQANYEPGSFRLGDMRAFMRELGWRGDGDEK